MAHPIRKKIKLETIAVDNGEYGVFIVRDLSLDSKLLQNTKKKRRLSADEDDEYGNALNSMFNADFNSEFNSEFNSSQIVPDCEGTHHESTLSPLDAVAVDKTQMFIIIDTQLDFYDEDIGNLLPPYESDNSSESENLLDEWQHDDPKDEFKPAKCLKCSQKVYNIQDCPRHDTKV